jgi:hypothetical protein
MNARGQYGQRGRRCGGYLSAYQIGIHWTLHPIADRTQVVDQLTTETHTLYNELVREMGANPNDVALDVALKDPQRWRRARATIEKSPLYPIFRDVLSPFLDEWHDFVRNYSEWSEALWLTKWETLEDYADRWHAIYAKVKEAVQNKGGTLLAPPPAKIPDDVVDNIRDFFKKAAETAGSAVGDVWKVAKYGIYAGLGLGGIFLITKLVEAARAPTSP